MSEYKIKISYCTGSSLGSEDIELTWENLDVAKENLNRIKEHYEMYRELNSFLYRKIKKRDIFNKNSDKEWFVNVPKLFCISSDNAIDEKNKEKVGSDNWEYRADEYYAEYCLKLKADNGNEIQIRAFWCGYFETLYEAEITLNNSDMKISFI